MNVITRFAPSPTGALHLGGARTALFSYLWAKHMKGHFLLRIEDTDRERSDPMYTASILASMRWLGLEWSEPLWYQSTRLDIYKSYVQRLLDTGHAYYCTCSAEDVERMRERAKARGEQPKYDGTCREKNKPYTAGAVVRLKTPYNEEIHFKDCIKGDIAINTKELDDMVLWRADGMPTYNLAVVVDDHEMGVTHVIRGDDHTANTPKQILLYMALGLTIPQFAHVPMILGSDKQKLSKRHGATAVIEYEKQGFLSQAMVNYLVRLGWSHGDEELFTMEEMIELFTLEGLNASPSAIDFDKLRWVNAHYIKTLPANYIAKEAEACIQGVLETHGITQEKASLRYMESMHNSNNIAFIEEIVYAFRERVQTLVELAEQSIYCFMSYDMLDYSAMPTNVTREHLIGIQKSLRELTMWHLDALTECLHNYISHHSIRNKELFPHLRYALTAVRGGPDIPMILLLLGKEESLLRLARCLECI